MLTTGTHRIGITLGFTLPRVPAFSFSSSSALVNATGSWQQAVPTKFSRAPTNFSFPAYASLQVDTGANYIPITFTRLRANIFDLQTSRQVAKGDLGRQTFKAKAFTDILLPLNFTYVATNDSDQTCKYRSFEISLTYKGSPYIGIGANWYNACKNVGLYVNGTRPRK